MQELRDCNGGLTETYRRSRNDPGVDHEDFFVSRGADNSPAAVTFDLGLPERASENEIGISPRDVLEGNLARGRGDVVVDVFSTSDVDELGHEAARSDRD